MPVASFFTPANLLTLSRTILIVPFTWCILNTFWVWAIGLFIFAVISDIWDGKLARKRHEVTPLGGLLDHGTDAGMVTCACWALAELNLIPALLVILIPTAFIQYMLDSKALAGQPLRTSAIGKTNGIAYFVLVGTALGAHALASLTQSLNLHSHSLWVWLIDPGLCLIAWALIVSTIISMTDRALALARTRSQ